MVEEIFVSHRARGELFFEEHAELLRLELLGLRGGTIRQGRFEIREFFATQFAVEPGCPLFLKRFHKHLSTDFAVSCAHKTSATLPCRWSIPAFPRFHDTAFPPSPSLKLRPDVRARVV